MPSTESDKPASAPDVMPPHPLPRPGTEVIQEGTNETTHSPDPKADQHPAREGHKPRGPYVTGNT